MQYITALLLVFMLTFYLVQERKNNVIASPSPTPASIFQAIKLPAVLGAQVKTTGCISENALPDKACTPGDIFPKVTVAEVCKNGYNSSISGVSSTMQQKVYAEYGIPSGKSDAYEITHLISTELGGNNALANLWPEPAESKPGVHEKNLAENYLHDQVCSGKMTLQQAQGAIAKNWIDVYRSIPNQ